MRLTAIDLFAGAGGLTLGMNRAGFEILGAIEQNPEAVATYRANFPSVTIVQSDIRTVGSSEMKKLTSGQHISLVMGCAPCQGFCSLTAKHHSDDPRNTLVLEIARFVEELLPDAVFMENVPGLTDRGSELFDQFIDRLKSAGYYVQWRAVQMADYGVPQKRRRLVLLAGKGFGVPIPEPTHARAAVVSGKRKPWKTVRETIDRISQPRIFGKRSIEEAETTDGTDKWHVVRNLRPITLSRLSAARPGASRTDLPEELLPDCHKNSYAGFRNVYGRMRWDEPSPTITGGCTTPAKGRFGHPDASRTTISVREAALLQTFPTDYRFVTSSIDSVCEMIGNAVPPEFAEAIGRAIRQSITCHHATLAKA